jgi:nitroimidazol reductase NimA-like FMN-containing flavoprotein (pyridoxamine 5'-phosphate oxidase superfamily)
MTESAQVHDSELKARILSLLDENRLMSLATVRPDGWPQVTMVGYVHDELALYFRVGRNSQKLANMRRDPRVSIALGRDTLTRIRGLSMAARVAEVTDREEVRRVDAIMPDSVPKEWAFAPRDDTPVLLRATPMIISVIELGKDTGQPELVHVTTETTVRPIAASS